MVRAFARCARGRRIDPSSGGPIDLFLVSSQCSKTGVTKCRGMCCPVCGMVHIKEPLLLIGKSSLCGGSVVSFITIRMVLNHMSDAI